MFSFFQMHWKAGSRVRGTGTPLSARLNKKSSDTATRTPAADSSHPLGLKRDVAHRLICSALGLGATRTLQTKGSPDGNNPFLFLLF